MIGKRKRQVGAPSENNEDGRSSNPLSPRLDAQDIFRRHFEAQFEPLPEAEKLNGIGHDDDHGRDEDAGDEEEEWAGLSDVEEHEAVQVVQHIGSDSKAASMSKEAFKTFMTSKPPNHCTEASPSRVKGGVSADENDLSEAANLKNDLALQRLLSESHLLESSTNPVLQGSNRHKATDLRLQALGSKTSILKQAKMPMSHRKGITLKQNEREETRRREARENGIILEKAKLKKKKTDSRRERGIGAPGVGKFSGGTLSLSKKDIFAIEGPKRRNR